MARRTTTGLLAATALGVAATAGCGVAGSSAHGATNTARLAASTHTVHRAAGATTAKPRVTKVLVFMIENHSLAQMKAQMPRTYALAKTYAYATDYHAIRHPSLPNYLAIAGGSTFGVTDDANPSAHHIPGRSVFSQARSHGETAKVYADSMPSNCHQANAGNYAVRHNPWIYFVDGRPGCRGYDVPFKRFSADVSGGRLPNVGFVIPNLVHDAHNASLGAADKWIGARLATIKKGPDWKSGRLAVVVTADEDDDHSGNKVMTVLASRYQRHEVVKTPLDHYSLTRLIDDVTHRPYLRKAATAPSMTKAFGVNVS